LCHHEHRLGSDFGGASLFWLLLDRLLANLQMKSQDSFVDWHCYKHVLVPLAYDDLSMWKLHQEDSVPFHWHF
jgi:hypothetical protein